MMGYFHIDTGKEIVVREIQALANKLGQHLNFDPVWMLHYEELIDLREDLRNELLEKQPSIMTKGNYYGSQ